MSGDKPLCKFCLGRHFPREPHPPEAIKAALAKLGTKRPKPKGITSEVRNEVLARNGGRCVICNKRKAAEVDHVITRGLGGRKGIAKLDNDDPVNLRGVCNACHLERHHALKPG